MASSQGSGSPNNEEVLMEENEGPNPNNTPVTPFARRVSFGAQAFGSVRSGSFSNGTKRPSFTPLAEKPSNQSSVSRSPSTATQGKSRGLFATAPFSEFLVDSFTRFANSSD